MITTTYKTLKIFSKKQHFKKRKKYFRKKLEKGDIKTKKARKAGMYKRKKQIFF